MHRSRWTLALAAVLAIAVTVPTAASAARGGIPGPPSKGEPPTEEPPTDPPPADELPPSSRVNPFDGAAFFVDPGSNAARAAASSTDPEQAARFQKIAEQAQADWFGDWYPTDQVQAIAADRVARIRDQEALPVFVVYAIPSRDCGGYSSGGTNSPGAYRAWIAAFAAGLDGGPVAVILEPDALAQLDCLHGRKATDERLALLSEAVDTLAAAGAAVYLDAGNAEWHPAATIADRLVRANVAHARGFSLNVSNFFDDATSVTFGDAVSSLVGGKPFVVDTSRNGNGPTLDRRWCNPPGRALGQPPTVGTGNVDAFFWIKRPGESDGTCNGGPPAGTWWPDYAEQLAANATW